MQVALDNYQPSNACYIAVEIMPGPFQSVPPGLNFWLNKLNSVHKTPLAVQTGDAGADAATLIDNQVRAAVLDACLSIMVSRTGGLPIRTRNQAPVCAHIRNQAIASELATACLV
jgi:hypothetical protein